MKKILLGLYASTAMAIGVGVTPVAAENLLGQIILGGWNFCPRGTAQASGALLAINSNQALFSLYGTIYGGDGRTTFALPDLRGRYATGTGRGTGLSDIRIGQRGGREFVTLNQTNLPSHSHTITNTVTSSLVATNGAVNSTSAAGAALANQAAAHYSNRGTPNEVMKAGSVNVNVASTALNTGGNQSFSVKDPYLGLQYCVVMQGIFPSRN